VAEYVLVNIGCLECGVGTEIVGRFSDKGVADEMAKELGVKFRWRQSGENCFEVFELAPINEVKQEYLSDSEGEPER